MPLAAWCSISGAFRVNDGAFYEKYYGFTHRHPDLLKQAVYGLAEWSADALKDAQLIAVPLLSDGGAAVAEAAD